MTHIYTRVTGCVLILALLFSQSENCMAGDRGEVGLDDENGEYTGPDAPDMVGIPLDQKIVFHLSNDPDFSNNADLDFVEEVQNLPDETEDSLYRFEGYLVYQLDNPDVPLDFKNLTDPNLARVVFQADLRNDVREAYNWYTEIDPFSGDTIYFPVQITEGANEGLRHSFVVEEDAFALPGDDPALVNGDNYYFTVIAYAYNNFSQFDPFRPERGQQFTAIPSTRNLRVYEVEPRESPDTLQYNSDYGDGVQIIRIEGAGNPGVDLIPDADFHESVLVEDFDGEISYLDGHGPLDVNIIDPVNIRDGAVEVKFFDSDPASEDLLGDTRFTATDLSDGTELVSATTIDVLNEVLLEDFGISILFGQLDPPGSDPFFDRSNGFVSSELVFSDPDGPEWLSFLKNQPTDPGIPEGPINFIKNQEFQDDYEMDPFQAFTEENSLGFYPYCLFDYRQRDDAYITPAWVSSQNVGACAGSAGGIKRSNNVDLVFTSDTSKWSRTAVVQSASRYFTDSQFSTNDSLMFQLLQRPAASKEAGPDGMPLDDPDLPNGYAWFPGYAVDVETGERLNVFFGENTIYRPDNPNEEIAELDEDLLRGNDRMWNPGSQIEIDAPGVASYYAGGQHNIYITNQKYDGGEEIRELLAGPLPNSIKLPQVLQNVTWAGIPLAEGLLGYEEGLIPNDATLRLRVNQPYRISDRDSLDEKVYNTYQIIIEGKEPGPPTNVIEEIPPSVEASLLENPGRNYLTVVVEGELQSPFNVEVYSLNGQLIHRATSGYHQKEINASSWSSGMYLVRVFSDGLRPVTLKWVKAD